ncbi:MAG TPA: hypothetical protein VLN58_01945 [Verrucomicrobiae bacterium]|nr:hypothetical protein [Verrucomicrobiae bacterium]
MLDKFRKLVLFLMAAMVLLSPFMQLDSWDNFPRSTDDIELQIIFGLCLIGMFLVFVGVAKLLPEMILSAFVGLSVLLHLVEFQSVATGSVSSVLSPPLRI